ncbi:MAG: hypothetical protein J6V93_05250 [Clostridia bacterium]|nr:hypothetical protein [Clostridia bacterium]
MNKFVLTLFSQCEITGEEDTVIKSDPADAASVNDLNSDKTDSSQTEGESVTGANAAPAAAEGQGDLRSRRDIYNEFIRAHKDLYAEDTQKIINRRFKELKAIKEALEDAEAEIGILKEKLRGKTPCPPDADFLSSHPGFSLEEELENEVFAALYNSGIAFDKVYKASHSEELAEKAAKAILDNIHARGIIRSRESAASASLGCGLKRDVSRLTKNERADMARRAMAGEKIRLN